MLTVAVAVSLAATSAAACKSSGGGGGTTGGGGGSTSQPTTGGGSGTGGGKTLTVGTDLPLQGSSADTSGDTNKMINLYLDSIHHKAGNYTVNIKPYDDSTAAAGKWDDAQCAQNAKAHVANTSEVAVMGTFNSGCAAIEIPVLNQDPSGPMLMVSHANTYVGLTKPWDTGEPQKYYPTGKRNYARVVTTDNYQGTAAANFASQDLHAKSVYILNDNQVYGIGVAKAFQAQAQKDGMKILGNDAWDAQASNYTTLFQKIKATNPDMVYFAGIYDNNGGQLIKDKVAVLGDNKKVPLMVPDGFTGYPEEDKLPQAQGEYLTFAGLSSEVLSKVNGPGAKLLAAFKQKYGRAPSGSYPLYGVAAMQVILAAIAKSDGTRASVVSQVVGGSSGITIPQTESVTGKAIVISPQTGDTTAKDITVETMKNNQETFFKSESVQ
ncbi:MAG TPA: branched-chain amino acid ABC transporter substrate-binding protein [Jatrophihabitans sp.]|jgi:branched-chain amino acid transport system substrate-binding protein